MSEEKTIQASLETKWVWKSGNRGFANSLNRTRVHALEW
jgi:hypothetical protein